GPAFEKRDLHPQPRERLRELGAHGPAPDDQHALRPLLELVENRFVGVETGPGEAIDRRNGRTTAGRDDEIPCTKTPAFDLDFLRRDEPRLSPEDIHPETFEAFRGVMGSDLGALFAHSHEDTQEIELGFLAIESPRPGIADARDQTGG